MILKNLQTNDSYEVIKTIIDGNLIYVHTIIGGSPFVITITVEEYNTLWQ